MPLSPTQTNQLLQSLGHEPRKQLGQNFLIDGNIVQKSVRLANVQKGELVVEIGPGLGTLTESLLEMGAQVYAVELDKRLHANLAATLQPRFAETFDLLQGDAIDHPLARLPVAALREKALRTGTPQIAAANKAAATPPDKAATSATPQAAAVITDIAATADTTPTVEEIATAQAAAPTVEATTTAGATIDVVSTVTADFKIVANLPYAISTPWLEAVLCGPVRPRRLVLMLQKEAAERFVATHGSKTFGAISIFTQSAYRVAASHAVSRQCFYPIPKVDSVLLALEALPQPLLWTPQARALVRQFFIHRRKQIGSLVRRAIDDAKALANTDIARKSAAGGKTTRNANCDTAGGNTVSDKGADRTAGGDTTQSAVITALDAWLAHLKATAGGTEARPEAIPLADWQRLAQLLA